MLIMDRIEGGWAVLEWEGQTFQVPRALLPGGTKEGDVLTVEFKIDSRETERRRQQIKRLEDRLFRD